MLRTIAFYDRMQPASPSSVPRAIGLHGKVLSGVPQNTIVCSLHTIALRLHSSVCFWKSAITSYAENEHASSQRQIRLYFFRRSIRSWVYNHIHQPKQVTRYRPETPRPVGIGIAFSASPPKIRSYAGCTPSHAIAFMIVKCDRMQPAFCPECAINITKQQKPSRVYPKF